MTSHFGLWAPQCGHLVTPDPCVEVDLDAVTLPAGRGAGAGVTISEWAGWDGGPGVSGGALVHEAGDGAAQGDVWMQPRTVTLSGMVIGASAEETAEIVGELSATLVVNRWSPMVVYEQHLGLERQLTVARAGAVQVSSLTPTIASYTLSVQADDWRRVSTDLQVVDVSADGTPLRNLGTAPAALSLHLQGPLTNPGVTWSGGAWQYAGTVATGQTISVDLERRVVRDPATTAHTRHLAAGAWPSLLPGLTTMWKTGTGAGSISARWRSSWA